MVYSLSKQTQGLTLAFIEGRIYTGKNLDKVYEALGITVNRIKLLGTNRVVKSACDSKTKIIRLNKRVMIPGFIDAHTHFIQMGVNLLQLDLSRTRSLESLLKRVRNRCKSIPKGRWVLGSGWDESEWPEKRYPTLTDLDKVSNENPVWLRRVDGHMGVANMLALEMTQISQSTRGFERDHSGKPTGILREEAMEAIEEKTRPDHARMVKGFERAILKARQLGVTSIHDMAEPEHIKLYEQLAKAGELGVRIYLNFFESSLGEVIGSSRKTGEGTEYLKLGALKLFADGSIGARTAALWEPYSDDREETGILVRQQDELDRLVERADRQGIQLAIHCIGERGIDAALKALEVGCNRKTLTKRRHRLEHFELVEPGAQRRARKLHLILSMQPNYVDLWSKLHGLYERRLGRKRLQMNNPFGTLFSGGFPIAFGSDCMPFSPLYGIYSTVHAPLETQRLNVRDAIVCYTSGSAYASFDEEIKGTIEAGRLADLAVLSNNPVEDPSSLDSTRVDMTVFDGRVVFVRPEADDLRCYRVERRRKDNEKTSDPKMISTKRKPA
jgi:predicted amidohydrolase YtcJ